MTIQRSCTWCRTQVTDDQIQRSVAMDINVGTNIGLCLHRPCAVKLIESISKKMFFNRELAETMLEAVDDNLSDLGPNSLQAAQEFAYEMSDKAESISKERAEREDEEAEEDSRE